MEGVEGGGMEGRWNRGREKGREGGERRRRKSKEGGERRRRKSREERGGGEKS